VDWSSSQVLALLQIIGTNVVLSGDNAVLVAMAVHRLPAHQRRPALVIGLSGAVFLQILATTLVARLLTVPLLLSVGGFLLCGVALKLLGEEKEEPTPQAAPVRRLGHAIWTILMANLIMSLDNVLAVAGVGRTHPQLIVFGLLLSITLLITGSLFISELMNKYPMLVTLGAGILAWTAGRMIGSDVIIQRIVWVKLGTDLQQGPFPLLLPASTTMIVAGLSSWRR
jgi:YjbE family integral membrane protein